MRKIAISWMFLLFIGVAALSAQHRQTAPKDPNVIMGRAFWDQNGNGFQDEGEPGIAGVEVNDEYASVETDETGYFALRIQDQSHYVRYTVPDEFRLVNTLCLDVSRWENRQIRLVLVPLVKLTHD